MLSSLCWIALLIVAAIALLLYLDLLLPRVGGLDMVYFNFPQHLEAGCTAFLSEDLTAFISGVVLASKYIHDPDQASGVSRVTYSLIQA